MRTCIVCKEAVHRRNKDGWSVLACPGWFTDSCKGHPLAVMPSPPEEIQHMRPDVVDEGTYFDWINTRLRQIWPPESVLTTS